MAFHDLVIKYGGNHALKRVDGFVPAGKMVAVMGPTGAGKSTLLKALADQQFIDSGRVLYDGKELKDVPHMKSHIAMVDQDDVYLPELQVRETLIQSAQFRMADRKACEKLVDKYLKILNIDHVAHNNIGNISGGQVNYLILKLNYKNPKYQETKK